MTPESNISDETRIRADGIPTHPRESWDVGAISQALRKTPEAMKDVAHGPGVRYRLGENGLLQVELFPPHAERTKGIIRLSTDDSLQEFYRQPEPAIREEGLIFETSQHLISLSPTGELMTYRLVPDDAAGIPEEADDDDAPDGEDGDGTGGSQRTMPATGAIQPGLPATEKQPRVSYGGRLGTNPRTKTTPKGRFVMEFPVAVKVKGSDKADWHNTVVFDEKARKLEGVVAKGVHVDVIAYEHRNRIKDRTGQEREIREYYATSVTAKPRTRMEPQGAERSGAQSE